MPGSRSLCLPFWLGLAEQTLTGTARVLFVVMLAAGCTSLNTVSADAGAGGRSSSGGTGGARAMTGGAGARGGSGGAGGVSTKTGGAGGRGGSGGSAAGGVKGTATEGTTCSADNECASGHCADGVCCNTACTGQCEACDVEELVGRCAWVRPGSQPHGARAKCAGTGVCAGQCDGIQRDVCVYPSASTSCRDQSCTGGTETKAATCDGKGACGAIETVSCTMGCSGNDCLGACKTDAECGAASAAKPYCDQGTCVALKPRGKDCTKASECASGFCVDGYCCDSACTDQCASCKQAGALGICQIVVGAPVHGECPGYGACIGKCNGQAKVCQFPGAATACGLGSVCRDGILTPSGTCDGTGSCTQTPMACPSGYCGQGSCGACPDDASCGSARWCDAGTCRDKKAVGATCTGTSSSQCVSGTCQATAGAPVCCVSNCSGATRCTAAGTGCECYTTGTVASFCPTGNSSTDEAGGRNAYAQAMTACAGCPIGNTNTGGCLNYFCSP